MPELPDLALYVDAIRARLHGARLNGVRIASPSLLRTVDPPWNAPVGRALRAVELVGKRLVLAFDDDLFAALHLMIAGRLRYGPPGAAVPAKVGLAAFDFDRGALTLVEASPKKRAALHVLRGRAAVDALDAGGVDPLGPAAPFVAALRRENRTLKRALTDPRLVAAVGNAYSDEILHRARLSPLRRTGDCDDATLLRLHAAAVDTLTFWIGRLREETGDAWPTKVTAFRKGMAVHGRFGLPCPDCGAAVQRITYAEKNDCNYCPTCQTEGRLLADRSLSKLMRDDWPRTLEELEERMRDLKAR
ncbi:MAG TPA: DNA-formamidopyrimidine glycosylase family protein [Planctomycetota bacterium]|nr:DNA-formamidopyrimidine glycosylase family protein [Planctomycetota bacterium]